MSGTYRPLMDIVLYIVRERGDGTPDFAHFRQKYPDTLAKRKIPRSSEKNPDVVTLKINHPLVTSFLDPPPDS